MEPHTHLFAFSYLKDNLVTATANIVGDELKVYHVQTGKIDAVFNFENDSRISCLSFITAFFGKKKLKGQKKAIDSAKQYILLGRVNGDLQVFDIPTGSVISTITKAHRLSVSCISQMNSGQVATASMDGCVKIWSISEEGVIHLDSEVHGLESAAVRSLTSTSTGSLLAIGQHQISIWNGEKIIKTFPGHSGNDITHMQFVNNDGHLASMGGRNIFIWSLERTDPLFNIPITENPDTFIVSNSLLSILCNGKIKLVNIIDKEVKKKMITLRPESEVSFSNDLIICYLFSDSDHILTVRGSLVMPMFECVSIKGQMGDVCIDRPSVLNVKDFSEKKRGKMSDDTVISANAPFRSKPDVELRDIDISKESEMIVEYNPDALKSVTNLLSQGLRSHNNDLIESALNLSDESLIVESIEKLPQTISLLLLDALVQRIVKSPMRATQLAPWIRCLHIVHGDHLTSLPKYQSTIKPLQDIISIYSDSFQSVLQLKAKIDLIIAKRTLDAARQARPSMPLIAEDYVEYKESSENDDLFNNNETREEESSEEISFEVPDVNESEEQVSESSEESETD